MTISARAPACISFFALYANIDGFTYKEAEIPFAKRPEIDRWILSELGADGGGDGVVETSTNCNIV